MNTLTMLAAALVAVSVVDAIISLLIWRSLASVLKDLCGTTERAKFWTTYSITLIFLASLLSALFWPPKSRDVHTFASFVQAFLPTFRVGLLGLLAALLVVGGMIAAFAAGVPPSSTTRR